MQPHAAAVRERMVVGGRWPGVTGAGDHALCAPTVLAVPRRSLVLVAGIPGAGKSTLLRGMRLLAPGAVVLDSDPLRERLRRVLPAGTPYRVYRAAVHLWHRARILLAVLSVVGPVVVHLPATGALTRGAIALVALLACRRRYLVWVDAEPDQARRGQLSRQRVLGGSCFARHARRGAELAVRLRDGYRPRGWQRVAVLDRRRAGHGLVLTARSMA
jgi:energy-coupling factor transporter ATP-binding protein EcfA2